MDQWCSTLREERVINKYTVGNQHMYKPDELRLQRFALDRNQVHRRYHRRLGDDVGVHRARRSDERTEMTSIHVLKMHAYSGRAWTR